MGRAVKSHAEPKMLAWCRNSARQTVAAAAKKAKVPEATILAWEDENGSESPSFTQLKALASLYKRPTCVFYLTKPPADFTVMKDFRSRRGKPVEFSPELALAIRESRERSAWLSGLLRSSDEPRIDFISASKMSIPAEKLGLRLRGQVLGMTLEEQFHASDTGTTFRIWRQKCEEAGVCVFIVRKVEVSEMRGFAVVDEYAPVVGINGKDSASGKTFTLLHEMAHLLLGADGVSDTAFSSELHSSNSREIETFCNAVAAAALVPLKALIAIFDKIGGDNHIATVRLAKQFKVSEEVIARRLLEAGKVESGFYRRIRAICAARAEEAKIKDAEKPKREVIIQRYKLIKHGVGVRFATAAIGAFHEGEIDGAELSRLLGMKLDHLRNLELALQNDRIGNWRMLTT